MRRFPVWASYSHLAFADPQPAEVMEILLSGPLYRTQTDAEPSRSPSTPLSQTRRSPMRLTIALILVILGLSQPASAQKQGLQEVRVRWDAYIGAPAPQVAPRPGQPSTNIFTVRQRRWLSGSLPRHRHPKLSEDQLV